MVFQSFDVLDLIGFLSRKSDQQANLKFMGWTGFKRFKKKYGWALAQPLDIVIADARYTKAFWLEKFLTQIFNRLAHNDNNFISKQEMEALEQQFLVKDCGSNDKEKALRKQVFSVTKKYLKLLGLVEKQIELIPEAEHQESRVTGLKLSFSHFGELTDSYSGDFSFNELDYFKSCVANCKIVFKQ